MMQAWSSCPAEPNRLACTRNNVRSVSRLMFCGNQPGGSPNVHKERTQKEVWRDESEHPLRPESEKCVEKALSASGFGLGAAYVR